MIETLLAFDTTTVIAFAGACLVLFLTPGADMMFTIASGAAGGSRAGAAAAIGISCGSYVHVMLTAAGLGVLLQTVPGAYDAIRLAGAAYLLYLAIQMWRADPATSPVKGTAQVRRAFTRGFLTNILNPKVGLFVLAFVPQFTNPATGPIWQQMLLLGLILSGMGGVLYIGLGALAGAFSAWLRRTTRIMNKLASCVFGGLAARLIID